MFKKQNIAAISWVVSDVGVWYIWKEPAGVFRLVSYASRVSRFPSGLSLFSYNNFGAREGQVSFELPLWLNTTVLRRHRPAPA